MYWILPALVITAIAVAQCLKRWERQQRTRFVWRREPLSDEGILAQLPEHTGEPERALQAWRKVAQVLHVPAPLLRADDTLASLAGLPHWLVPPLDEGLDTGELLYMLLAAGVKELETVRTVGDAVRCLLELPIKTVER